MGTMIARREIARFVKRIAEEFSPDKVILFGSFADGKPSKDSDVDLLVIMRHSKKKNVEQAIEISLRVVTSMPVDLLVRRPDEVKRRVAMGDMFLKTVVKRGKILYEKERQRVA
jgi:predicted nucleotidyltransferase